MDNNDALPRGNVPIEPVYTLEQLAQLQAAMMEELGIGRIDTLHLADKGAPLEALRPLNLPKKKMNRATAAWHTLHLDEGGDPTKDDLDNIADGQLYRMRRGGASSSRGGHFSSGHRGGGGNRGGHSGHGGHGGQGFQGPSRHDDRPYPSSFPRGKFMNDARMSVRGSSHLDKVQARLRAPIQTMNPPTKSHTGHGPGASTLDTSQANGKVKSKAQTSRPLNPLPTKPAFTLFDNDDFLNWAGMGKSATAQPPATPKAVAREVSRVQPGPTGLSQQHTPVLSAPRVASAAQVGPPAVSLGNQGLSGSKWGPSPQQAIQAQAVPASQQPTEAQDVPAQQQPSSNASRPITVVFAGSIILRQQSVKIKKNNSTAEKEGVAAMTKNNKSDELFTLELVDSSTGTVYVCEAVSHDAVFELHGSTIIYRAVQENLRKPPTWKMRFPLPMFAATFANFVILLRDKAGIAARPVSDMGHAPSYHSASFETSSYSAPEAIDTLMTQAMKTEDVYGQMPANVAEAQYHPGYELREGQGSVAFAQEVAAQPLETLITLGNDGDTYTQPSTMNSDIFDLLEPIAQNNMVVGLYGALGGDAQFFDHMSQQMVRAGGKSVNEVSSDELMSDPVYESTLREAVALFLSNTESFAYLGVEHAAAFIKHQSRKIMELEISRRGLSLDLSTVSVEENTTDSEVIEEKTAMVSETLKLEPKDDTPIETSSQPTRASIEDNNTQLLEATEESRIKYSPNSLLGLRDHAVRVEINEQPPRERRPTVPAKVVGPRVTLTTVRDAPPVTTTAEWQAFGAAKMNVVASVAEAPIPVPSAAVTEVRYHPKVVSQASEHSTAMPRKTSTAAPVFSTTNSWQAFAASEQVKTDYEAPVTSTTAPEEVPASVALPAATMNAWQAYATAEESKTSAQDQYTPTSKRATVHEMSEPVQESKPPLKSSVSIASVTSIKPSTVVNSKKGQRTDDARWAAMLGSVGSHTPVVKSELQLNKGLNIRTSIAVTAVEPTAPVIEQSMATPLVEVSAQSTPESSFRDHASLRSSGPAAPTPASQAMQNKITAALKQPLVASPVQSPASSVGRRSAVGGSAVAPKAQLKTEVKVKQEKFDSPPITFVRSEPVTNFPRIHEIASTPMAMSIETVKASSVQQTVPVKTPVVIAQKVEFGGPLPAVGQSAKSVRASDENINKTLKTVPGLSASKWADESTTTQVTTYPRNPPTSFTPMPRGSMYYGQGPPTNRIPTSGYAPLIQKVIVQNPDGLFGEVTGMVKAGSVPVVAQAPIPHIGPQVYAENVRPSSGHMYSQNYPTTSNSPVRPPPQQHYLSFGSVGSESKINPVAPTFMPSPQRPKMSAPAEQRPALSPRRGNIQSRVQSGLDSSMTGPRLAYQGPQS